MSSILKGQVQSAKELGGHWANRDDNSNMKTTANTPCANCERLQAQVKALEATVAELQAAVGQLQQQLAAARKDSSNSSKPPSSDITRPPPPPAPPDQGKRKPGGQPGHPKHERALFPPEMLTS